MRPKKIPAAPSARRPPFPPFLAKLGGGDSRAGTELAAILIVTALLYLRCLSNQFVFDDAHMIVFNQYLGNWSFIWKSLVNDSWWFSDPRRIPVSAYYRPLQDIWLAINFHLFGLDPAGWHAAAIALHLLAVWLVFRLASILTADRTAGLLAAAMFALMPIHAEAVVWATAIPLPLSAVFELGAFEFYLRGLPSLGATSPPVPLSLQERGNGRRLALSLVLFGGALLSHESAVVFPVLIAAHAFIMSPLPYSVPSPSGRGQSPREAISEKYPSTPQTPLRAGSAGEGAGSPLQKGEGPGVRLRAAIAAAWPYALEVAAYLPLRLWVLGFLSRPNSLNHLTARETMLTIPGAIWSYAILLAIPWHAGPAHELDPVRSLAAPGLYLPLLGLTALCAAGFLALRRHPHRRLYLFCAAWILIALGPMFNLTGLFAQSVIQDRYLYLPSAGFCVMAADLAIGFARASELKAKAVSLAAAAVLLGYAGMLIHVQSYWHDEVTLFSQCIAAAPGVSIWHSQLGTTLTDKGDLAGARRELETARSLDPDDGANLYALGRVYDRLGDRRTAARTIALGLKLFKNAPPDAFAYLAMVADAAGDPAASAAALRQAAALPGGADTVALTRAQLLFLHGGHQGAEDAMREILRRDPDNPEVLTALGAALVADGRYDEALAAFQHASAIAPHDPNLHYRIATLLHGFGREQEARDECAMALAITPDNRLAQSLMADIERSGAR